MTGELNSEIRRFIGKELKTQGTKTKDGQEVPWKLFSLIFENEGSVYPRKFTSFDKISDKGVQIKDMEEGQYYKILYKVTEYTNSYGTQQSRNVVMISKATESDYLNLKPRQPNSPSNNNTHQTNLSGVGNLRSGFCSGNSTPSEITLQNFLDNLSIHPHLKPRTPDFLSYEDKVRFGQAINLTFQLMTSHDGFKVSDYNYENLKDLLFRTVYPCINKFWLEFESRKKSLLLPNEPVKDNLSLDPDSITESEVNFERLNPVTNHFED